MTTTQSKKAVISNRITLPYNQLIAEQLTYPIIDSHTGYTKKHKDYNKLRDVMVIPVGREDLIPKGMEVIDKRVLRPYKFPDPLIPLRPDQQEVLDQIDFEKFGGVTVNANPSFGKTFTGLHIAHRFGQKTLILVHTVMLLEQWVKEVKKIFGNMPIGIVGNGKFTVEPITIALIHTAHKNIDRLQDFGLMIADECHRVPAATFLKVARGIPVPYRVGLSATLERKDYLEFYFTNTIGNKLIQPKDNNTLTPIVSKLTWNKSYSRIGVYSDWLTRLCEDSQYIDILANTINKCEAAGHKVLVTSSRTGLLEALLQKVSYGKLITSEQEDRSLNARVILGTESIFKEGVSDNELSCLIMATPLSTTVTSGNLKQIIGRILRPAKNKPTPLVVDISFVDRYNQNRGRLKYYQENSYKMSNLDAALELCRKEILENTKF